MLASFTIPVPSLNHSIRNTTQAVLPYQIQQLSAGTSSVDDATGKKLSISKTSKQVHPPFPVNLIDLPSASSSIPIQAPPRPAGPSPSPPRRASPPRSRSPGPTAPSSASPTPSPPGCCPGSGRTTGRPGWRRRGARCASCRRPTAAWMGRRSPRRARRGTGGRSRR